MKKTFLLLALAGMFAACGGGSGDKKEETAPEKKEEAKVGTEKTKTTKAKGKSE